MMLMKNKPPTHYQLLEVSPNATAAEIKKAYLSKAKQLHPDAGGEKEDFQRLNEAFRILNDPVERLFYDRLIAPPPPPQNYVKNSSAQDEHVSRPTDNSTQVTNEEHRGVIPVHFLAPLISACLLVVSSASYVLFRLSGLSLMIINRTISPVKNSWYVAWQHEVAAHAVVGIFIAIGLFYLEHRTGLLNAILTLTRPLIFSWITIVGFLAFVTTGELLVTPAAESTFLATFEFFLVVVFGGGLIYFKLRYHAPWKNIFKALVTP
jgi:hypothetical protein